MKAVKENREYTITEQDIKSFANDGYDILDDNGKVVQYGAGKKVSFDKYMKLKESYDSLMDEVVELRDELEKLKKKKGNK